MSIIYGCRSWFNRNLKSTEKLDDWAIQEQLWLRSSTYSNIFYVTREYPALKSLTLVMRLFSILYFR